MTCRIPAAWAGRHFCPECHREFKREEMKLTAKCPCGTEVGPQQTLNFSDMIDNNLVKAHGPWTVETALKQILFAQGDPELHDLKYNDAFIWLRNHAAELDEYLASK